jgi:hypothetical protein
MYSANQKSTIKLLIDGNETKVIPNLLINYSHPNIETFQKHVMSLIRLHPGEPLYECELISVISDDGERPIDSVLLKEMMTGLTKRVISGASNHDKIKLIVSR